MLCYLRGGSIARGPVGIKADRFSVCAAGRLRAPSGAAPCISAAPAARGRRGPTTTHQPPPKHRTHRSRPGAIWNSRERGCFRNAGSGRRTVPAVRPPAARHSRSPARRRPSALRPHCHRLPRHPAEQLPQLIAHQSLGKTRHAQHTEKAPWENDVSVICLTIFRPETVDRRAFGVRQPSRYTAVHPPALGARAWAPTVRRPHRTAPTSGSGIAPGRTRRPEEVPSP